MKDAWRLAVGTLSAVRVAPPTRVDPHVARSAMLLAPLAVLPLGVAVALVCGLGPAVGLPDLAVGLLAVATLVLGTRALHVDGLSDVADGLTASHDPARSLAVMKTGPSGPAGGAAVLVVLGLQAVGFAALAAGPGQGPAAAVLAGLVVCASRCALTLTCATGVVSAGEGLGRTFAGTVPRPAAVASWLVATGLLTAAGTWAGSAWWQGPLAGGLGAVVVAGLLHRTTRRLGGVTGDVYGAAIELALVALLLGVSL